MVLELKYVAGFKVEEIQNDQTSYLKISGLAMHSALYIDRVEQKQKGDDLVVLLYLSLSPRGQLSSGSFDITIELKPTINRVLFGEDKKMVWERQTSHNLHY
jgi:hypothetical protein